MSSLLGSGALTRRTGWRFAAVVDNRRLRRVGGKTLIIGAVCGKIEQGTDGFVNFAAVKNAAAGKDNGDFFGCNGHVVLLLILCSCPLFYNRGGKKIKPASRYLPPGENIAGFRGVKMKMLMTNRFNCLI